MLIIPIGSVLWKSYEASWIGDVMAEADIFNRQFKKSLIIELMAIQKLIYWESLLKDGVFVLIQFKDILQVPMPLGIEE